MSLCIYTVITPQICLSELVLWQWKVVSILFHRYKFGKIWEQSLVWNHQGPKYPKMSELEGPTEVLSNLHDTIKETETQKSDQGHHTHGTRWNQTLTLWIQLPVFQGQWIHLLQCWQDLSWTSGDAKIRARKLSRLISFRQIREWFSILASIHMDNTLPSGGQGSCCRRQSWLRASTAAPLDPTLCSCQGHTSPVPLPAGTEHSRGTSAGPGLWDRAVPSPMTLTRKFCPFYSFLPPFLSQLSDLLLLPLFPHKNF